MFRKRMKKTEEFVLGKQNIFVPEKSDFVFYVGGKKKKKTQQTKLK